MYKNNSYKAKKTSKDIASKKALSFIIGAIFIVFPTIYSSLFYKLSFNNPSFKTILNKYNSQNISTLCHKNYLGCFQKDFYSSLHKSNFIQLYFLYKLENTIYDLDQNSDNKFNQHFELLNNYFLILKAKKLNSLNFRSGNAFVKFCLLKFLKRDLHSKIISTTNLEQKIKLKKIFDSNF